MLVLKMMDKHPVQAQGRLKGYLSVEKAVRASVVDMSELVDEVCLLQKTSPASSVALGRTLIGTVLMASQLKDQQAISTQVLGSKTIGKVFAHAQYDGLCRGFISEKQAPLAIENNNLSLKPLFGEGLLQVVTYIPKQKAPHTTQVDLVSGEIGEDIAYYLNQSQQIPCLVSLAVKIGQEGRVLAAGGVLIELMPGHTELTIASIEAQQKQAKPLSGLIEKGFDFEALLKNHLGDITMKEVKDIGIRYHCTCSREKAGDSLMMLAAEDFQDILKSNENLNVDCEMCGRIYSFSISEVNYYFKKSGKAQVH